MREIENEIAPHRRTKGRKHFTIECRLTAEGLEKKLQERKKQLEGDLKWHSWFGNYELLRHAQQSLKDIHAKQKSCKTSWYNPYEGNEYRIVEKKSKS